MQTLWPVPLEIQRFPDAASINPVLVRAFSAVRLALEGEQRQHFFASPDDLLSRIELPEFSSLIQFMPPFSFSTLAIEDAEVWLSVAGCSVAKP